MPRHTPDTMHSNHRPRLRPPGQKPTQPHTALPASATNVAILATKFRRVALICAIMVLALAVAACAGPDFRTRHAAMREKFVDYVAVANATGRGALSTPLVRLVDVLWEYEALQASGADTDLHLHTVEAMRATINAFEQFAMSEGDDDSWRATWDAALDEWADVDDLEAMFARDGN